jgi:hypothetical protein
MHCTIVLVHLNSTHLWLPYLERAQSSIFAQVSINWYIKWYILIDTYL